MRKSRSKGKTKSVSKPTTRAKARNVKQRVDQRKVTYQGYMLTFSELNSKDKTARDEARKDFGKAIVGDTKTARRARYADTIDNIPILGDIAQLMVIARTEMEYQKMQINDFLIGLIPIVGDIADFVLTPDTNKKVAESRLRQNYYNSLIAIGKPNEAELYRAEVIQQGHKLRSPTKKELEVLLGLREANTNKLQQMFKTKLQSEVDKGKKEVTNKVQTMVKFHDHVFLASNNQNSLKS